MKFFKRALKDGYIHTSLVTQNEQLPQFHVIETEGYSYKRIDADEIRILPILEEDMYCIALYKNNILVATPLPVKGLEEKDV